ncbi:MAG: glycosyltransferase family 39 protein, partial [Phycisphaerales bacterium JB041]
MDDTGATASTADTTGTGVADSHTPSALGGTTGPAAWMVATAAACSALLALVAARVTSPGVGPDAVAYLGVANSIRDGSGIGFWLEDPLVTWPPLWPMLIAAGNWITDWRPDVVGLVINSLLLSGCAVVGNAVAARVLHTRAARLAMVVSLGVSPILVGLAVLVQTEVVLTLVVLVVTLMIMWFVERDQLRWLVVAGLATAIGFYVRYQALYIVPVFAGWLVLRPLVGAGLRSSAAWRSAIVGAATYSVPAVGLAAVWVGRNVSLDEPPLGPRFPSDVGPAENVVGALATTFKFVTSIPSPPRIPAAVVTLVVLAAALWLLLRRTSAQDPEGSMIHRTMVAATGWAGLLAVFTAGFTALMILSRSVVGFDDLDIRLLAPCLVPTSILFLRYLEVVFGGAGTLTRTGRTLAGLWLGAQVLVTLALIGPANSYLADYGFNAQRAVDASTSAALDELPDGCVVYSNNAGDLYQSGFEAQISPRKVEYKSSEPTEELAELSARVDDGELACLAWVGYSEDPEYYSLEELGAEFDLVRLASADEV